MKLKNKFIKSKVLCIMFGALVITASLSFIYTSATSSTLNEYVVIKDLSTIRITAVAERISNCNEVKLSELEEAHVDVEIYEYLSKYNDDLKNDINLRKYILSSAINEGNDKTKNYIKNISIDKNTTPKEVVDSIYEQKLSSAKNTIFAIKGSKQMQIYKSQLKMEKEILTNNQHS